MLHPTLLRTFAVLFSFVAALASPASAQEEEAAPYNPLPFPVRIGGQTAVYKAGSGAPHATIPKPVRTDAVVSAETKAPRITFSLSPSDEAGKLKPGSAPMMILLENGQTAKLTENALGRPVAPGWYIAEVIASPLSARILFKVE